jgi:hypothetical protein
MALGPGKYDKECTEVRSKTGAAGVLLLVFGGDRGNGFSCQSDIATLAELPEILRRVADDIERSGVAAGTISRSSPICSTACCS